MPKLKTISTDELRDAMESGDIIQVVNVLPKSQYRLGFIENSIKIPFTELDARVEELDRNQEVVTYCSGGDSSLCRKAAEKLSAEGYTVRVYEGGLKAWSAAGLPLESDEDEEDLNESPDAPSGLSGLPSSGNAR